MYNPFELIHNILGHEEFQRQQREAIETRSMDNMLAALAAGYVDVAAWWANINQELWG